MQITGLSARAALWSARHRKTAIVGWLAFVVLATVLSMAIGTRSASEVDTGHGDSGRADRIIAEAGFPPQPSTEFVIIQRGTPEERASAATDLTAALEAAPPVVSADGASTLIAFTGDPGGATDAVQDRYPGLYFGQTGPATSDLAIDEALDEGMNQLGLLSIPVTLGILLVAFGALVAALLPVVLALTAIVAAVGLLALVSRLAPTVDATVHVMLAIGLAVGVDYCLFYIRREREDGVAARTRTGR